MISIPTIHTLHEQIRRTARSLLQYTTESYPHAKNENEESTLACIAEMAAAETDHAKAIAKYLKAHRANPPHFGPYPMHFTTMNYLSLGRVLQLLLEHQNADIAVLENGIQQVQEAEGKEVLRGLLKTKQEHTAMLKHLIASPTENNHVAKEKSEAKGSKSDSDTSARSS